MIFFKKKNYNVCPVKDTVKTKASHSFFLDNVWKDSLEHVKSANAQKTQNPNQKTCQYREHMRGTIAGDSTAMEFWKTLQLDQSEHESCILWFQFAENLHWWHHQRGWREDRGTGLMHVDSGIVVTAVQIVCQHHLPDPAIPLCPIQGRSVSTGTAYRFIWTNPNALNRNGKHFTHCTFSNYTIQEPCYQWAT